MKSDFRTMDPERKRQIQAMGGHATKNNPKHKAACSLATMLSQKKLSVEQAHFVHLLRTNQFATAIRDLIILVATKAKNAEDWHRVLTQIMKLPFIEQAYRDIEARRQEDVIPIVIGVLRRHGQEQIIKELILELRRNGWNGTEYPTDYGDVTVPALRRAAEQEESQGRDVESAVVEESSDSGVLHVQPESSVRDDWEATSDDDDGDIPDERSDGAQPEDDDRRDNA